MSSVSPSSRSTRTRQFGSYVLGRRIGAGGMATVFAARQIGAVGATRVVAVKVMATALADDPAARRMFEREAVISTRVEHPNIVRTYEVGEVGGEIFLAMELVPGAALSTICARAGSAVPLAIAVRVACDVARGLQAVHDLCDASGERMGVVHLDVTPHNVVVGYDGTTKLLDFGVARIVALDGSRAESIRGKPAYLAPEQTLLARIDSRADIYGLGAVLFELLTGVRSSNDERGARSPDGAASGGGRGDPRAAVNVRTLRADVPEAIANVLAKALAIDPSARFETAEEMRRALTAARDACGLATVEENDVGAWVRSVAPPTWSLAELERELAAEESYHSELAAVAELPTMPEGPESSRARTEAPAARPKRWLAQAGGLLAAVGAALGAWAYASHSTDPARAPPRGLHLASPGAGEPPLAAGVHLLVTLGSPDSGAWAHVAFDHITVSATSGSQLVVVCLTPRAEGQRALVVPSPSPTDPDPCADLHASGFAGVNGVFPPSTISDDWDLIPNPWELDFDGLSPGDALTVRASAVFGGAAAVGAPLGIMRANGQAKASSPFSRVALAFPVPAPGEARKPGAGAFWGDAEQHCDEGETISSWLDPATFAAEPGTAAACPRSARDFAFIPALRSVATPTMGIVGRIPAAIESGCVGGEPDGAIVWKSAPVSVSGRCISFLLSGRFAQCASGDPADPNGCPTSVRCIPPPTDLVALSSDGKVLRAETISCVPSYPEPVQYTLTLAAPPAGEISLGLRRGKSDGGCFFDIYDFTTQPSCRP